MKTYYGVWIGRNPGIYESWHDCKFQIDGFKGAKFKKLNAQTKEEALIEFEKNQQSSQSTTKPSQGSHENLLKPTHTFLTVDGASNGRNCEFQAVWYPSGEKAFSSKVYDGGTNNIAEFLGIVFALKYLKDKNLPLEIYTDSVTAMSWYRNKKANTTATQGGKLTEELSKLLTYAEKYLQENSQIFSTAKIVKWQTKQWGEIPADFGRK